jgi:competence protein ComEA
VVLSGVGGLAAGAALAIVAVLGLGLWPTSQGTAASGEPLDAGLAFAVELGHPTQPSGIVVDVAGAVAQPGLHRLTSGDRVGDAIEAAGGFAPRADLAAASQALNLAQPLEDGTKVLVPELDIERQGTVAVGDGRLDLNRASQTKLESLPGVGPVTARKIMDARAQRRFSSSRDLRTRGLVGESVFDDIEDLVRAS